MTVALFGAMALGVWLVISFRTEPPERLREQALEAGRSGDWSKALGLWQRLDQLGAADVGSLLSEARAAEALGQTELARTALRRACSLDPGRPEPWLARLEGLRVEDRPIEARTLAWQAFDAVSPKARRLILRALTLSLLADVPADVARERLERRLEADPRDLDALAALARRQANEPMAEDPPLPDRVKALQAALKDDPRHVGVREALVQDLAIQGSPELGRAVLDAWPEDQRDARYFRLRGRWDLEYDARPDLAVELFRRSLETLPHDWKTRYRLARALFALNQTDASRQAAEAVGRLREALAPAPLGRRLAEDLGHLDDADSLDDLADLCTSVGLTRLAEAWHTEADRARMNGQGG